MSPLVSQLLLWGVLVTVVGLTVWLDRKFAPRHDDDAVFYLDDRSIERLKREARIRRTADLRASTGDLTATTEEDSDASAI